MCLGDGLGVFPKGNYRNQCHLFLFGICGRFLRLMTYDGNPFATRLDRVAGIGEKCVLWWSLLGPHRCRKAFRTSLDVLIIAHLQISPKVLLKGVVGKERSQGHGLRNSPFISPDPASTPWSQAIRHWDLPPNADDMCVLLWPTTEKLHMKS